MAYRIKNWEKFQHFKDRKPPWIKLYRDLLDDMDWHDLPADSAKLLVMLWLIASENNGIIPSTEVLSFRLRIPLKTLTISMNRLEDWLEHDDITAISERYQHDRPETEGETEKDMRSSFERSFEQFWQCYPKRRSRGDALKAWRAIKPTSEQVSRILAAINRAKTSEDWQKERGHFIPYPATWLRAQGWEDEFPQNGNGAPPKDPEKLAKKEAELRELADRVWQQKQDAKKQGATA